MGKISVEVFLCGIRRGIRVSRRGPLFQKFDCPACLN